MNTQLDDIEASLRSARRAAEEALTAADEAETKLDEIKKGVTGAKAATYAVLGTLYPEDMLVDALQARLSAIGPDDLNPAAERQVLYVELALAQKAQFEAAMRRRRAAAVQRSNP